MTLSAFQRLISRIVFAGFVLFLGVLLYIFSDLPSINSLPNSYMPPSVRITDRNGRLLYEIIPQEGGRNTVLSIDNIPQCLKDAAIAVEDKNFYSNPGIDVTGITRALWINIRGGETVAGGSTITQQVARNLLMSEEERTERTLRRNTIWFTLIVLLQPGKNLTRSDLVMVSIAGIRTSDERM